MKDTVYIDLEKIESQILYKSYDGLEDCLKKHKFNWTVSTKKIKIMEDKEHNPDTEILPTKESEYPIGTLDKRALIRDDHKIFFKLVKDSYIPMQNEDIIETIYPMLDKFHIGKTGSNQNGLTNFIQLLPKNIVNYSKDIVNEASENNDPIFGGINVIWSHGTSKNLKVKPFMLRLLCNNGILFEEDKFFNVAIDKVNKENSRELFKVVLNTACNKLLKNLDFGHHLFKKWKKIPTETIPFIERTRKEFFEIESEIKLEDIYGYQSKIEQEELKSTKEAQEILKSKKNMQNLLNYTRWKNIFTSSQDNRNNLWGLYNSLTNYYSNFLSGKSINRKALALTTDVSLSANLAECYKYCNKIYKEAI